MPSREVKLDKRTYSLIKAIATATAKLGIKWIVVGAASRVLLLEQVYGLSPGRATEDIDLGVMVANWKEYRALVERLRTTGLQPDPKQRQRLIRDDDATVDLIPFGDIESNERMIRWPPENEIAMTVLGFREAYSHAETVSFAELVVPVVNPVGLMLLKLVAWKERHQGQPKKDAADIAYVLRNYSAILGNDTLFERHLTSIAAADYDLELAAAHVLGVDTGKIAEKDTSVYVQRLLDDELKEGIDATLVRELAEHFPDSNIDRVYELMKRFQTGFVEASEK